MPRFVVQEHHATSHHFDPRLEKDGVLVSRAVPKGMPEDTKNRLARRVDDHAPFRPDLVDGTPVEGVPGATKKSIRNSGTDEAEEFGEGMVVVTFRGRRLRERFSIFRADEDWPIHKTKPGA